MFARLSLFNISQKRKMRVTVVTAIAMIYAHSSFEQVLICVRLEQWYIDLSDAETNDKKDIGRIRAGFSMSKCRRFCLSDVLFPGRYGDDDTVARRFVFIRTLPQSQKRSRREGPRCDEVHCKCRFVLHDAGQYVRRSD